MLAFELAGGPTATRAAGGAFIDALTIPERTASLGSIHTIVVHPPSHHPPPARRRRARRGRDRPGAAPLLGGAGGPRRPRGRLRGGARRRAGRQSARRLGRRTVRHRVASRPPAVAGARRPLGVGPIATLAVDSGAPPGCRPNPVAPARAGDLGPAHLGRLRGRSRSSSRRCSRPVGMTSASCPAFAFRSAGDYHQQMADPRTATTRSSARASSNSSSGSRSSRSSARRGSARPRPAGDLDRLLHPRPDAAAVAPVGRHPGRPAGAVLRPARCRTGPR